MSLHQGPQYADRDVAETAKLIRQDLKREFAPRGVKTNVTIKRYSMGRSIRVEITACPLGTIVDPNPAPGVRYTAEASALLREVESVVEKYRRTHTSDQPDDYYQANFHAFVNYSTVLDA